LAGIACRYRVNWRKGEPMSATVILGLIALACLILFFKVMGFLFKLALVAVILGVGYWYFAPLLGAPPLPF
jgi:hypothetical protein